MRDIYKYDYNGTLSINQEFFRKNHKSLFILFILFIYRCSIYKEL